MRITGFIACIVGVMAMEEGAMASDTRQLTQDCEICVQTGAFAGKGAPLSYDSLEREFTLSLHGKKISKSLVVNDEGDEENEYGGEKSPYGKLVFSYAAPSGSFDFVTVKPLSDFMPSHAYADCVLSDNAVPVTYDVIIPEGAKDFM